MDTYKEYSFKYHYAGVEWGITLFAKSEEEAKDKIRAVEGAEIIGEITEKGVYDKEAFH